MGNTESQINTFRQTFLSLLSPTITADERRRLCSRLCTCDIEQDISSFITTAEITQLSTKAPRTLYELLLETMATIYKCATPIMAHAQHGSEEEEEEEETAAGTLANPLPVQMLTRLLCSLRLLAQLLPCCLDPSTFENTAAPPAALESVLLGCTVTMARLLNVWMREAPDRPPGVRLSALLRAILVSMSRGIFAPREANPCVANPVLAVFTRVASDGISKKDPVFAGLFLQSLFEPVRRWLPSRVPYGHLIAATQAHSNDGLVLLCIHVACALLTFPVWRDNIFLSQSVLTKSLEICDAPCKRQVANVQQQLQCHDINSGSTQRSDTASASSAWRSVSDLAFGKFEAENQNWINEKSVFSGLMRLLRARREEGFFPGALKTTSFYSEILALIYHLMIASADFSKQLEENQEKCDFLVTEVLEIVNTHMSMHDMNILRISLLILGALQINETKFARDIVVTLHRIIKAEKIRSSQLYDLISISLSGISQAICTSEKDVLGLLIEIFLVFSSTSVLTSSETAWQYPISILNILERSLSNSHVPAVEIVVECRSLVSDFLWMNLSDIVAIAKEEQPDEFKATPPAKPVVEGSAFIPTEQWFFKLKEKLVFPLIECLLVESSAEPFEKSMNELFDILGKTARHSPKPITPAREPSQAIRHWIYGFFWGACFLRHQMKDSVVSTGMAPLWQGTVPRLFVVKSLAPAKKEAVKSSKG